MPDSPKVSLIHDSLHQINESLGAVEDIWRHEGLKRGVEYGLKLLGSSSAGRLALEKLAYVEYDSSALTTHAGGLELKSPMGIGAGWDKTGKSILGWQALGASHVNIGGITLYPQPGNPMPRLRTFEERVGDRGHSRSLNSYGFYSPGTPTVVYNIAKQRESGEVHIPVIGQVTLNKEFYKPENLHLVPGIISETCRKILPVVDGISLGLSSPNTEGMRDAQNEEFTRRNILAAKEVVGDSVPVSYKGDGDGGTERLDMYCEVALDTGLDIIELINTTGHTHIKARYGAAELPGGLAGGDPEYQDMAVKAVSYVYDAIGDKVDIIGLGGVGLGDNRTMQAERLIRAGASALGMVTGVRELGAKSMELVNAGLADVLSINEFNNMDQLIGIDSDRGAKIAA